jgi:hypothetical protein
VVLPGIAPNGASVIDALGHDALPYINGLKNGAPRRLEESL